MQQPSLQRHYVTVRVKGGYVTAENFSDMTTFVFKMYHHQRFGRRFVANVVRNLCSLQISLPVTS